MAIVRNWGKHQAIDIQQVTITDGGGCSASIITYGAILQDLKTPDSKGNISSITLGLQKVENYIEDDSDLGIIAGRFANRIAFGCYNYAGQIFHLERNNGVHHLHGGTKGTGDRAWTLLDYSENCVELGLQIPALDDGYPGDLEITCRYKFIGQGHLRLELSANVTAICPINLAQHSYFNLEGVGQITNHLIQVHADKVALVDASGIPVHSLDVQNTPYDFRHARTPTLKNGQPFALDNSFHLRGSGLREVANVCAPVSGRTMSLFSDQPELQVYTAHGLNTSTHGPFDGLCLEPQCIPNAPNTPDADCFYGPGRPYTQIAEYKFGIV